MTDSPIAPKGAKRHRVYDAAAKARQKRWREKHQAEIKAKYQRDKDEISAQRKAARQANLEEVRRRDRARVRVISEEEKAKRRERARLKWATDLEWVEAKKAKTNAWRAANKNRDYARDREYRKRNAEKVALWRAISKSRKLHRIWYRNDPQRHKDAQKRYHMKNPEAAKAIQARARARRVNAPGHWTRADIERIRIAQRNRCAMCRKPLKGRYHIDHIIPLAKQGTNWPSNLQLLCAPCNLEKHDADPIDFARRRGLLV